MQEKQGVATRLLYQLYISLEKKKKAQISGTVMEIMQPAATVGLHKKEHEIYCDVCVCMFVCPLCKFVYSLCNLCLLFDDYSLGNSMLCFVETEKMKSY